MTKNRLYIDLPYTKEDADKVASEMQKFKEQLKSLNPISVKCGQLCSASIKKRYDDNTVLLSVGGKYDVVVSKDNLTELDHLNDDTDNVNVYVDSIAKDFKIDISRTQESAFWQRLEKARLEGSFIICRVLKAVHCGYMVEISKKYKTVSQDVVTEYLDKGVIKTDEFDNVNSSGCVTAFLPRSQCMSPVKEDDLIYVAVISIENRKKNIIVSIKKVVFEVKKKHQEQLFDLAKAAMDRGDVLWAKITVTNVVDFGLFGKVESVTVKDKNNATVLTVGDLDGCIDGLLHSSEMGWQKDNKTASTKYSAGDVIDLIVKNIDRARNRMHFTMRGLKGNPWMGIADKLTVGQIYKECIVAGVSEGNVVVTIPGVDVEGLIKPSEISWDKHKCDVYQLIMGTKIDVMVIEVNPEEQKLFLSTKKAIDMKNIITLKKKFEANDNVVNGIVRSVSHDAISVELEGGLMGKLLHRNLDWDINKRKIDMYKAGDEIKSKIVRFNEYTEEIELGKKQFEADPLAAEYDRIQVGGKYSCEIYNIEYSNIMVRVNGKLAGFIHYTQLSSDKTQCSTANYKIGQKIDAIVVKIDRDLGIVKMTLIDNTAVEDKKKVEKV